MPGRSPPTAEDRNAARARALRAALQGALRGFGDLVLQRDLAELTGDLRRKKILATQITELLGRLDDPKVQDAFAAPLGGAYTQGFGGSVASVDKDRIRALADGFVSDAKSALANTRTLLPFINSKLLDPAEQDKLREAAIQATAEGLTTKQLAKRLQAPGMPVAARSFPEDGKLWVTFGNKRFPADLYAETLARTTTYHAANRGTLDRCLNDGVELVESTASPYAIDFCLDLGGKIFALNAEAARKWSVPLLSSAPSGGPPYHPNCRCVLSPFLPDDSERGELPTAPSDVLTRSEGQAARRSAEAAFKARLEKNPLPYAQDIGRAASVRGFGNATAPVPEDLRGQEIPGLKVGAKEKFQDRGFAEDVMLAKLMTSGNIGSRKELRQVLAQTVREGKADRTREGMLSFNHGAWRAVVDPKKGLAVSLEKNT